MQTPSAPALLAVWERGRGAESAVRALLLLAAAEPGGSAADLPVGSRNRRLLALQALLFRPLADAVTECPDCAEVLEVSLAAASGQPGYAEPGDDGPAERELRSGEWAVRFRLPTAGDLVGLPGPAEEAVPALLGRCVLAASRAGAEVTPAEVPPDVVGAVDEAVEAAGPAGALDVAVRCQGCVRAFVAPLDPVAFLWSRLEQWGWRQLPGVHDPAGLFGWDEHAVLAIRPWRRPAYLAVAAS